MGVDLEVAEFQDDVGEGFVVEVVAVAVLC